MQSLSPTDAGGKNAVLQLSEPKLPSLQRLAGSWQLPLFSDLILWEHEREKKPNNSVVLIWEQGLIFSSNCIFLLLQPACKGCIPNTATSITALLIS